MVLGANPALHMYMAGRAVRRHPLPQRQRRRRRRWPSCMVDRGWGATMVLTEPDAGSDVGAGRTKAIEQRRRLLAHRGRQALHHLGRARPDREHRPPGAGPPRGRRRRAPRACRCSSCRSSTSTPRPASSASATAPSSPTSSTRWASRPRRPASCASARHGVPAMGWLVGDVHDGIAQMFQVIEHARMMVGTKAIATLSTGYLNALDYAKTRVQSADLTQAADKTAPRVTIINHPDVRRSLMLNKAYAEGLRALVLYTASAQDRDHRRRARAASRHRRSTSAINDLLLPIVKGVGSERSYDQLGAGAADLRRLGLPAGLPARAVHPRRQDRHPLRGHDGDPGPGLLLPQDRQEQGRGARRARRPRSRRSSTIEAGKGRLKEERGAARRQALEDFGGMRRRDVQPADERPGGRHATSTRSARTPPACCCRPAT